MRLAVPLLILAVLGYEEGFRAKPYRCPAGKWTIGKGRNYQDRPWTADERKYLGFPRDWDNRPMTAAEADAILASDVQDSMRTMSDIFGTAWPKNEARQAALVSLCYQMGPGGFRKFRGLIDAVKREDWELAADNVLYTRPGSKVKTPLHAQTPERAKRCAEALRSGRNVWADLLPKVA